MIEVTGFKGKTVGVFGLARSGLSAIRSLKAGGASVLAWDDKESMRLAVAKEGVSVEPWERWAWSDISAVVPPSATIVWPMMNSASSEHRKAASLAMSGGAPQRAIGIELYPA